MNIVTPPKLLCYSENNFIYFVNDSVPQDFGVGAYPTLSVSAAIDADGETIVFFSSETKQEITRRKFDNIADKNGVDYGVDAATAFQAINTALGVVSTSGGGGGGGDATAANQVLQITELQNINANTLPVAVLFNRVQIVGLSGFSIPRPFRWAKIERPSIGGSIDNDSVTIQDANGGFSELYAGDTIELPLLSLQNIYNFNLDVQISNPDIELFISYNE